MPEFQVKKVVAVCFMEAVKLTLDHLGIHRMQLAQEGQGAGDELTRKYGDVRRLRDHLQRTVGGFQDSVMLDLSNDDAAYLTACCRRAVETIATDLDGGAVTDEEQRWLERKQEVLCGWAVEFATKPVVELKLPRLSRAGSEALRVLDGRISDKIFGDVESRKKIVNPGDARRPAMTCGVSVFDGALARPLDPSTDDDGASERSALNTAADVAQDATTNAASTASAKGDEAKSAEPRAQTWIVDPSRLQDPRLRALVAMDTKSFQRAEAASDLRMAAALLASITEAVTLDHAQPRRAEFGLSGPVDKWNLRDVVLRAMGENVEPRDRALVFQLFAARNLLRPAVLLSAPVVITRSSYDVLRRFVGRAVHAMGFGAGSLGSVAGGGEVEPERAREPVL